MEWKKLLINALITFIVAILGVTLAIGRYAQQIDANTERIHQIETSIIPSLENRVVTAETNLASINSQLEGNLHELEAIQRDLIRIERLLESIQSQISTTIKR